MRETINPFLLRYKNFELAVDNIDSKKVMTKLGFEYHADSSFTFNVTVMELYSLMKFVIGGLRCGVTGI